MSEETQQPEGPDKTSLAGTEPTWDDSASLDAVLAEAVDYRGDVTVHTADDEVITGYLFDRRPDADPPVVRMLLPEGNQRIQIPYEQIKRLIYSGRDTAEGKSWETFVKKYNEKKAKGETLNLEPEPLD